MFDFSQILYQNWMLGGASKMTCRTGRKPSDDYWIPLWIILEKIAEATFEETSILYMVHRRNDHLFHPREMGL